MRFVSVSSFSSYFSFTAFSAFSEVSFHTFSEREALISCMALFSAMSSATWTICWIWSSGSNKRTWCQTASRSVARYLTLARQSLNFSTSYLLSFFIVSIVFYASSNLWNNTFWWGLLFSLILSAWLCSSQCALNYWHMSYPWCNSASSFFEFGNLLSFWWMNMMNWLFSMV